MAKSILPLLCFFDFYSWQTSFRPQPKALPKQNQDSQQISTQKTRPASSSSQKRPDSEADRRSMEEIEELHDRIQQSIEEVHDKYQAIVEGLFISFIF